MKTITQRLFIFVALISLQGPLCAYKFTFRNKTGEELRLTVDAMGIKDSAIIKDQGRKSFNFDKLGMPRQCLTNVFVQPRYGREEQLVDGPFEEVCESGSFVLYKDSKTNKIKAMRRSEYEKLAKPNGSGPTS